MVDEEELVERIPSEEEDKEIGVPIYKIVSYPSDPTLEVINDKWVRGEVLISGFQRKWVWTHAQASKLVDSFLLGLPVPPIFVYKDTSQKQIVIDGQQRLRTIHSFFDGKLPDGSDFFLKGVSPQWEGKRYDTLDESDRIRLRDSVLRVVVVEQLDPKDMTSIYHIFERLNTGGTALSAQEVRNCIYHGPFNDLIVELNNDKVWRQIFGATYLASRMRDIELVLRFLALYEELPSYMKPMKQFLNMFMGKHQQDNSREPYESIFRGTMRRIYDTLGSKTFHLKRGINVAAFDSVAIAFARSKSTPKDIKDKFQKLTTNPSYIDAIRSNTTDVEVLKRRVKLAEELLF